MRLWTAVPVALALVGALVIACGDLNIGEEDFGCCPDVQTGCTLFRYGKKTSKDDRCIVGFDGVVPNPSQAGWTKGTRIEDGCPFWAPPPNATMIQCGAAQPRDSGADSGFDAALDVSDASSDATTD